MDIVDRMFEMVDEKYHEQRYFAYDIGVDPVLISRWRNRKSTSYQKYLPQIAEVLRTTTEYLLTGKDPASYLPYWIKDPMSGEVTVGKIPIGQTFPNFKRNQSATTDEEIKSSGNKVDTHGHPESTEDDFPQSITPEAMEVAKRFDMADEKSRAMVRLALGLDDDMVIAARGGRVVKKPSPASAEALDRLSLATEKAAKEENDQY